MNSLDRIIKRERNARCRYLRKLRRARDMASKHSPYLLLLSELANVVNQDYVSENMTGYIAKKILDKQETILSAQTKNRPPK